MENLADLRGDRHGVVAGGRVDSQDVAVRAPHAHQRLEPLEVAEHLVERRARARFVGGPCREVERRSHREADALHTVAGLRRATSATGRKRKQTGQPDPFQHKGH